jgi:hypothetical protein
LITAVWPGGTSRITEVAPKWNSFDFFIISPVHLKRLKYKGARLYSKLDTYSFNKTYSYLSIWYEDEQDHAEELELLE